ncbi:hypothetical protein ACX93W_22910 [Paenibacillus sp. CAU 1782]
MDYRIVMGKSRLTIGSRIDLQLFMGINEEERALYHWELPEGVYLAKDIVREAGTLLEAICIRLGDDSFAEALLNNVRASLALTGREAVLPLAELSQSDHGYNEVLRQAQIIGETISNLAKEGFALKQGRKRYGSQTLRQLTLRSRCDQHLWTPEVVQVLMGPGGNAECMELFNEYLHQLILLRNSLLPFVNWQEVPIPIGKGRVAAGLRFIEPALDRFITRLFVRNMPQKEMVHLAQNLLAPEIEETGYAFQYRYGIVLPAIVGDSTLSVARSLLRWHPARLSSEPSTAGNESLSIPFHYSYEDYKKAPRSFIEVVKPAEFTVKREKHVGIQAKIVPVRVDKNRFLLSLRWVEGQQEYVIDVGQAARGYRYMYRSHRDDSQYIDEHQAEVGQSPHRMEYKALQLLELAGLVAGSSNISGSLCYVSAEESPLIFLALLGKLYPQNVVFVSGSQATEEETEAGKGFGTKVLIYLS